jgi:uncharacterized protein
MNGSALVASQPTSNRLLWVDSVRGLAILLMIPANLSPYFAEPHPLWYRVLGSCAAPLFISVSAGMVVLGAHNHSLAYYCRRGGWVVLIGALIDIGLWGLFPFTSVDVLYLIGLSIPIAFLSRNLRVGWLLIASVIVFATSDALQRHFGYHPEPLSVFLNDPWLPQFNRLLASWFIDGWFPVFPWLGFVFLGTGLFKMIFQSGLGRIGSRLLLFGILLSFVGMALLFTPTPISGIHNFADGTIIKNRVGYSEIFYPPTPAYVTSAVGVICSTAAIFGKTKINPLSRFLGFFGRHAMLIYILHQVLGVMAIALSLKLMKFQKIDSGFTFMLVVLAIILAVVLVCEVADRVKAGYPPKCLFLQILFGK